jgi:hypothetical protein
LSAQAIIHERSGILSAAAQAAMSRTNVFLFIPHRVFFSYGLSHKPLDGSKAILPGVTTEDRFQKLSDGSQPNRASTVVCSAKGDYRDRAFSRFGDGGTVSEIGSPVVLQELSWHRQRLASVQPFESINRQHPR